MLQRTTNNFSSNCNSQADVWIKRGVLPVTQTVKHSRHVSDVVFALVSILPIRIMTLKSYVLKPINGC